jgi:hypothetical protein
MLGFAIWWESVYENGRREDTMHRSIRYFKGRG